MVAIDWMEEVIKRKESLVLDTQQFLRIKSVYDASSISDEAPFGKGILEALLYLLHSGESAGISSKNIDGFAGHLEIGEGQDIIGVLCYVDVVPEGNGWTSDPFGADIRDGKIYARGALDDKAPTMAVFYAMKIIHELGLSLSKRVRLIIGTDEESEWRCVEHYFKKEEMPIMGFAPDADFPIIHAEKGICDVFLRYNQKVIGSHEAEEFILETFTSGNRLNMVPDDAKAIIRKKEGYESLIDRFQRFLQKSGIRGLFKETVNSVEFSVKGVSVHGSLPEKGVNAGLYLASFLHEISLDPQATDFVGFIHTYFWNDIHGHSIKIFTQDNVSGRLTVNVGIIEYIYQQKAEIGMNIRYPVTDSFQEMKQRLERGIQSSGFSIQSIHNLNPNYIEEDHPLINVLKKVYEEQTGEEAVLLSIGGGTYARALESGVAFGPLFKGREEVAHQKDEHFYIEDLLKATAIYAQAIYQLAK